MNDLNNRAAPVDGKPDSTVTGTADTTDRGYAVQSDPADTEGGQPQEDVEDRPNVSTVDLEDYPKDQVDH